MELMSVENRTLQICPKSRCLIWLAADRPVWVGLQTELMLPEVHIVNALYMTIEKKMKLNFAATILMLPEVHIVNALYMTIEKKMKLNFAATITRQRIKCITILSGGANHNEKRTDFLASDCPKSLQLKQ